VADKDAKGSAVRHKEDRCELCTERLVSEMAEAKVEQWIADVATIIFEAQSDHGRTFDNALTLHEIEQAIAEHENVDTVTMPLKAMMELMDEIKKLRGELAKCGSTPASEEELRREFKEWFLKEYGKVAPGDRMECAAYLAGSQRSGRRSGE